MNSFIKNSIRFILFLLVQVVVLKEVPRFINSLRPIYILYLFCGCPLAQVD